MNKSRSMSVWAALLVLAAAPALAADASDKPVQDMSQALAKRDAKGVAANYTEDASLVEVDGHLMHGRAEIEKYYTDMFAKTAANAPPDKVSITPVKDRKHGATTVLEDGTWTFDGMGPDGKPASQHGAYTCVLVQQKNGQWLIAQAAATPEPPPPPPPPAKAK